MDYTGSVGWGDVASRLAADKWDVARFVFNWGAILVPGGAILSNVRKASYIRKGYKVVRDAPRGRKLTALEEYVVSRPIRSTLFAGGGVGTAVSHPATNPLYYQIQIGMEGNSYIIGQYLDREGKLRNYLPSGQILSGLGGYTSRTGTEARSFMDMNGIGLLKSISTPTPKASMSWTSSSKSPGSIFGRGRMTKGDSGIRRGGRTRTRPWWFSTKAKRRISRKRS